MISFSGMILSISSHLLLTKDEDFFLGYFVFEFSSTNSARTEESIIIDGVNTVKNLLGVRRDSDQEGTLLERKLVGIYENELNPKAQFPPASQRINRSVKVKTGRALPDTNVPAEIEEALRVPHFIKAINNILPYSDTGLFRVRISIRQGRILGQRTQVKMVHEF